jgi:hypothetical protein
MRIAALCLAAFLVACASMGSQPLADNPELATLYREDQAAREGTTYEKIDWVELSKRDAERRNRVRELLAQGTVRTSMDFFHAAMLFQHGSTPDEYRLAYSLANVSATLDPSNKTALWLSAAAWDRLLMSRNVPQWYGTQFTKESADGPWILYKVDESITDEERAHFHVPPLKEARERVKELNK